MTNMTDEKDPRRADGKKRRRLRSALAFVLAACACLLMWGRVAAAYDAYVIDPLKPNFEASQKDEAFLDDNDRERPKINDGKQQSKGAILEVIDLGNDFRGVAASDDVLNFYVTEYRINDNDQWEGFLSRYESIKDKDGYLTTTLKWERGGTQSDVEFSFQNRRENEKLRYWNGTSFAQVEYTGNARANSDGRTRHPLPLPLNFTPVNRIVNTTVADNAKDMDLIMDAKNVGTDKTYSNKMHPMRAFVDWYYGYDISYNNPSTNNLTSGAVHVPRTQGFFADPGNSGMVMIGPMQVPESDPFPGSGYREFARQQNNKFLYVENGEVKVRDNAAKLFFQTNDGLLHVIDAKTGDEDMAILPPPSLLPHRAWSLKTFRDPVPSAADFGDKVRIVGRFSTSNNNVPMTNNTNTGVWDVAHQASDGRSFLQIIMDALNKGIPDYVIGFSNDKIDYTGGTQTNGWPMQPGHVMFEIVPMPGNKAALQVANYSPRDYTIWFRQDEQFQRMFGTFTGLVRASKREDWDGRTNSMVTQPFDTYDYFPVQANRLVLGQDVLVLPRNDYYRWIDPNVVDPDAGKRINSRPMFTLDGPLQLRYFYMPGYGLNGWTALLLGTLGRGGGGLYAMDVTDPSVPKFLWHYETIEGVDHDTDKARVFSQVGSQELRARDIAARGNTYWNGLIGGGANPNFYPYEQLGFNLPKPGFGVSDANGTENIIAVPAGMPNTLKLDEHGRIEDNGKMGAALYLINPDPAKSGLPAVFNNASYNQVGDRWKVGKDYAPNQPYEEPYMGMMISETTFLGSTSNGNVSRGILAADNRGNIHSVTLSDNDIKTIGSLRITGESGRSPARASFSIPHGVSVGYPYFEMDEEAADYDAKEIAARASTIWVGGGTADIGGWINPMNKKSSLQKEPDDAEEYITLENHEQMLFCFSIPTDETSTRDKWSQLNAEYAGDLADPVSHGWYIPLKPADAAYPASGYGPEYTTVRPFMNGGTMYAATFRELGGGNGYEGDNRSFNGQSRLYAINIENGNADKWTIFRNPDREAYPDIKDEFTKYLIFEGIKLTGFTPSIIGKKNTLVISYNVLGDDGAVNDSVRSNVSKFGEDGLSEVGGALGDNHMQIALKDETPPPPPPENPVKNNDTVINYWRYVEN